MAITCSQCQHTNPDTVTECRECRAVIAIVCIECGSFNPLPSRYCGECGVKLERLAPPIDPFISEKAMESPPPRPTAPTAAVNTPPPRPGVPRTNPAPTAASSGTRLQLAQAVFVHLGSNERLALPADQSSIYVGKPNEDIPPDIDVSHLPGAEIVSRIHAAIHNRDGVFTLEDAGSSNGTFLNGELIKPGTRFRRELKSGDTVSLGKGDKCSFRFELAG